MVRRARYAPSRGDVIWLQFDPQRGHEQRGLRLAFTVSPRAYNDKVGLGLFCPITTQVKGYPFEVAFPDSCRAQGVVLADQVKSLDYAARRARLFERAPDDVVEEVLAKIRVLVEDGDR
jgi:mRNA interferase MazF